MEKEKKKKTTNQQHLVFLFKEHIPIEISIANIPQPPESETSSKFPAIKLTVWIKTSIEYLFTADTVLCIGLYMIFCPHMGGFCCCCLHWQKKWWCNIYNQIIHQSISGIPLSLANLSVILLTVSESPS